MYPFSQVTWRLVDVGENEVISYTCTTGTLSHSAVSDKGSRLLQGAATLPALAFPRGECRRSQDFLQVVHQRQAFSRLSVMPINDEITIVSGLPRSGTSLMTKMLEAGDIVSTPF